MNRNQSNDSNSTVASDGFLFQEYRAKITTITPIHITSGDNAFPFIDYIVDNEYFYFYESDTILNELSESELKEMYGIIDNNRPSIKNNLFRSISEKIKNKKSQIYKAKNLTGNTNPMLVHGNYVYTLMKHNNRPYIPGSSVKGAFSFLAFDDSRSINRHDFGFRDFLNDSAQSIVCYFGFTNIAEGKLGNLNMWGEFVPANQEFFGSFLINSKNNTLNKNYWLDQFKKINKNVVTKIIEPELKFFEAHAGKNTQIKVRDLINQLNSINQQIQKLSTNEIILPLGKDKLCGDIFTAAKTNRRKSRDIVILKDQQNPHSLIGFVKITFEDII